MEYQIQNIRYKANKINCGHETILCCLQNQNTVRLKLYELYFATDPNIMDMIPNTNNFGYLNLEGVIKNINKNTNAKIQRIIKDENTRENVISEISKDNVVLLYVDAGMLNYQNIASIRYPFHMVIVTGYNTKENYFRIIDTFQNDDKGICAAEHNLNIDFVIKHTIEYCVFEKNKSKEIYLTNSQCVKENIKKSTDILFCNIDRFFIFLENINKNMRIDCLAAFRWIVSGTFFFNLLNWLKELRLDDKYKKIEIIYEKWETLLCRYIKDCYKNCDWSLYKRHEIEKLIVETRKSIENI